MSKEPAEILNGIREGITDVQNTMTQTFLQLPLSKFDELPQEQKEAAWNEMAGKLHEMPDSSQVGLRLSEALLTFYERLESSTLPEKIQTLADADTELGKELQATLAGIFKATLEALEPFGRELEIKLKERLSAPVPGIRTEEILSTCGLSSDFKSTMELWEALRPYIAEEADSNPEFYNDPSTPASVLMAAAAARARADGKNVPPLKVEGGKSKRRERINATRQRQELAAQKGALIFQSSRLPTIGDKNLGFQYFTSVVCKELPENVRELALDEKGKINTYDLTKGGKPIREVLKDFEEIHSSFLMCLLEIVKEYDIREKNSDNPTVIPLYLPKFMEKLSIDPRPREWAKKEGEKKGSVKKRSPDQPLPLLRLEKFMELLNPLRNVAGWFGEDLYLMAGFDHYDAATETIYITAPYIVRLMEYAKLHSAEHAAIREIFHANIMTENQTAVEVANRIAMGLLTRGVTRPDSSAYKNGDPRKPSKKKTTKTAPDGTKTVEELTFSPDAVIVEPPRKKTFTFDIRFSTIIKDCPQFQRELDEIRSAQGPEETAARAANESADRIAAARRADHKTDPQRVNKKLKDIFTAAIRIIMEKSDIPNYYKDIVVRTSRFDTFKAPTKTTLDSRLEIVHYGKNPNFEE